MADFCTWSLAGLRIKREKLESVATGFDFEKGVALPTPAEGILYAGAPPLTSLRLAAEEALAYHGMFTV
jgi:hypothetical protein